MSEQDKLFIANIEALSDTEISVGPLCANISYDECDRYIDDNVYIIFGVRM